METERVKIFASIVDDATLGQLDQLSSSDAYSDSTIRLMPDCHAGKGCTVGSVIRFTDRVVPNTVGVDLGCGMLVMKLTETRIDLARLDSVINTFVPSGFHINDSIVGLRYENCTIAPVNDVDYISRSIGTLGGGNHFIEVDVDSDGNYYLVIHSGSRNLGVQVCNYWQNRAVENLSRRPYLERREEIIKTLKEQNRETEIEAELSRLKESYNAIENPDLAYLEGKDLDGYLHDVRVCQKYAQINRLTIANQIVLNMNLEHRGEKIEMFETIHNYIDVDNRIIRKGAVSAQLCEKLIIPMNMRDGSLICVGKGNPDWLWSAPHGAGRVMSRSQARKNLSLGSYKDSMKGIYSTSVCEETIDEAPMAYKPADAIMEDIKDTVDVVDVIKPIYNFKAKEGETKWQNK